MALHISLLHVRPMQQPCLLQYYDHVSHVAGAQTLQLRDNYRSTPQVLRGAEGVLENLLASGVAPDRVDLNPLLAEGPQIQVPPAPPKIIPTIPGVLSPCT